MIAILRILLALSVFFTHVYSGHWFSGVGGDTAVELFFVISGFYMQEILADKYKNRRNFYYNRLLRIIPIYLLVLIATILHDPSKYINVFKSLTIFGKTIFIESNLTLFGLDQHYFVSHYNSAIATSLLGTAQPATDLVVVPVAWSISIELIFYAIVPFIVKLKTKHLTSILIISLTAKYLFLNMGRNSDPWTYRFLPFEISFFLIGMLISRFRGGVPPFAETEQIAIHNLVYRRHRMVPIFSSFRRPPDSFTRNRPIIWLSFNREWQHVG